MDRNTVNSAAEQLKLKTNGAVWFGCVGQWPVTVSNVNMTVRVSEKRSSAGFKELRTAFKNIPGTIGWNGNTVIISFPAAGKLNGGLAEHIKCCVGALSAVGLKPEDVCPVCKQGGCNCAAFMSYYTLAHSSCVHAKAAEKADAEEKNNVSGNYITGILGAIIGMIVGTIPSFLTITFMQREWALLFALIPICSYYGYKLFGGKMNRSALVVSIVAAIAGVYLLQMENLVYYFMGEYGLTFGEMMTVMPELLTDPELWIALTQDSVMEFVFAALGVWFAWRTISGTAAGSTMSMKFAEETMAAYPGYTEAE